MNAETTEKQRPLLSDEDIAVLNRARTILKTLAEDCQSRAVDRLVTTGDETPDAHDFGYIQGFAEEADMFVFKTMVRVRYHGHVAMSEEQIHNLEADVVEGHPVLEDVGYVGDVVDPFQGESPTEHDRRL